MLDEISDQTSLATQQLWNEGSEMYRVTGELMGSSVLRIGEFPFTLCRQVQRDRVEEAGDSCNELYWTMKSLHRPSPQEKWKYQLHGKPHSQPKPIDLMDVFDYSERNRLRTAGVTFRVRNWKQRPMQLLKKKVPSHVNGTPSNFAILSNFKFKCFSKCFLANSVLRFNCPVDLIL